MPPLRPTPLGEVVERLRREAAAGGAVLGLERRRWWRPDPALDLSATVSGARAAHPVGPAAGPQTQLAPNIAAGWLAGARVFELKTVQVLDGLEIPRPCIHAPNLACNVEWSQELALRDSLREYARAAWLVAWLRRTRAFGEIDAAADLSTVFDLSVGYDLAGLRSAAVGDFLAAAREPAALYAELADELSASQRAEIGEPPEGPLARGLTISTFHGCPPAEIEAMAAHLLDGGWPTVVKLNPTLLGLEDVRGLLHGRLGFQRLELDESAFEADLKRPEALAIARRLKVRAAAAGLEFGLKFSNTLVLRCDPALFPSQEQPQMYLSGPPLHVLAMVLAERVLGELGEPLPLSFSAGLDAGNAADTLACGFAPLTLCTELLRSGGLGRLPRLLQAIETRMRELGARDLEEFRRTHLESAETEPFAVQRGNLARLAQRLPEEPRYSAGGLGRPPRALEQPLARLDCLSCDLCLTACPNAAFFVYETPGAGGPARQYALWADACNECGNCELWCPEAGAPQLVKERVFSRREDLEREPASREGLVPAADGLQARLSGRWLRLGWNAALPEAEDGGVVDPGAGVRLLLLRETLFARGGSGPAALRREALEDGR